MTDRSSIFVACAISAAFLVALFLGACSSDSTTTATTTGANANNDATGFAGCTNDGTIGSGVPDWIANNFLCTDVSISGGTITMTTDDQPPYYDLFWDTSHAYYSTAGDSGTFQVSTISESLSVEFTFPASPTLAETDTIPMGASGITIHGVLLFNNEANAPDILVDEIPTMDQLNLGHTQSTGYYHHHTEPPRISDNDSVLIGVALDGFPIFGRQEEDGSIPFTGESVGNNYHSHAVDTANTYGFDGAVTYHYHVVDSDYETTSDGVSTEVPWMLGPTSQTFAGGAGTVAGGP